jgi:hypothetical protein
MTSTIIIESYVLLIPLLSLLYGKACHEGGHEVIVESSTSQIKLLASREEIFAR